MVAKRWQSLICQANIILLARNINIHIKSYIRNFLCLFCSLKTILVALSQFNPTHFDHIYQSNIVEEASLDRDKVIDLRLEY